MSKILWGDVYKDFKRRYPKLKNEVVDYSPYDYLTILVKLKDGREMIFDYQTHTGYFTK